jgi:murein DD-endopeptidase MepM/ murein hydrolase activator NlpD
MTSSFGITPQRQIRDLVAGPEKPQDLARPAEPAGLPQQIGGQLQYSASYQQDNRLATAVKGIENFLSKEGAFTTASETLFENYKLQKYNEAKAFAQQEANAYKDSIAIGDEAAALKKVGDSKLARETSLSNPWVNFFYYDTKATNAGKDIAVQLGAWGNQNAEKLAEIDDPGQRSAAIAAKAQELMKPYADIPAAFQTAKIDPLVSAVNLDLKKVIYNKNLERKDLTRANTAAEKFLGPIRLGASVAKGTFGSEQGTIFAADAIQNGYNEAYAYFVTIEKKSEKEFNAILFREIPNLFIDKNGDGYSDIGETYSYLNFQKALNEIKTADGQSLLSLRNAKGQTMREALEEGAVKAVKAQETFEGSVDRGVARIQKEYKREQANASNLFYAQNPNPNDDQIVSQREAAKANATQAAAGGLLPDGLSLADAFDQIDRLYPFQSKDISPEQQARLQIEVDDLIAQGVTQMPADLAARLEGTPAYGKALVAFAKSQREAANPATQKTTDAIVRNLLGGLKGNFQSKDEQLKAAAAQGKAGDAKEKFLQPAVTQASQRLKAEGTIYIRRKLSEAAQRGENINDPAVQLRISQDAQSYFYQRPEYSDVDSYYDITNLQSIGKAKGAPVLGSSKKDATGRWQISIQDADNRASFAAIARPYFVNNPAAARTYLSNEFVLNEKELGEINRALATGSMSSVSASTRRSLGNLVNTAFGNKISTAELVQKQMGKFFDGNVPPSYRENALKLQVATRTPVAGTGVKPQDTLLYVSKWSHTHSKAGNQAVDFFIERGNQAQSANPLPSPISGIVRFSGQAQGFGNTVVIEALENGPGYRRGDRLLFGHAARLNVQVGQRVNRGQFILVAGDKSRPNSVPGRSSTGTGDAGHLHSQLFRPGQGFPSTQYQYGQEVQNNFVRKNLFPLFRSVDDPNRR